MWMILLALVGTSLGSTDCGAAQNSSSVDCGSGSESACVAQGCCWNPLEDGSALPWCYSDGSDADDYTSPESDDDENECGVAQNSSSIDCGSGSESTCVAQGCCWNPLDDGSSLPWCFRHGSDADDYTPPESDDGCWIWSDNQCEGDDVETPETFEERRWFTPTRDSDGWQDSFQDYDRLVGYAHVTYETPELVSAVVEVIATHRDDADLTYSFDGVNQESPTMAFTAEDNPGPIKIIVTADDGAVLALEDVDFAWNAPTVSPQAGNTPYRNGQKGGIVEFFGWPHADVLEECSFLADAGYMGAKLFPPQEQVMSSEPFQSDLNPWYFMYQPVSYRLGGRMGTRDELRKTIKGCRELGVRVYADAVVNHMVGGGNDLNPDHRDQSCNYWGAKETSQEAGPSSAYTQCYTYTSSNATGLPPSQEFPAVPYGPTDFHCERVLNSWTDPLALNAGWLDGLVDLNTEKEYVQDRIAMYLTDLISIGFSGFRIDAAKHMQPADIAAILGKVRINLGGAFPEDFVTWLEVLLGGESDMLMCDPDSGYNYGSSLADLLKTEGLSDAEVDQVKIWNSGYPKEPQLGYCTISPVRNAIQNDDADQQTEGSTSRDMGDAGCVLIEDCSADSHRSFETKLFSDPNGIVTSNDVDYPIRLVLSSFYWQDTAKGIPDGKSDCSLCVINCDDCKTTTKWDAYDPESCGYDDEYTRPHRDISIINAMRDWMGLESINHSDLNILSCTEA